jgi:hypothetical protein
MLEPQCLPATTEPHCGIEGDSHSRIVGPSMVIAHSTDLMILAVDLGSRGSAAASPAGRSGLQCGALGRLARGTGKREPKDRRPAIDQSEPCRIHLRKAIRKLSGKITDATLATRDLVPRRPRPGRTRHRNC